MRWFKHLTAASRDCLLAEIEEKWGLPGYGRFWKLIETVAAGMDKGAEPAIQLPWSAWCAALRAERKELQDFLAFLRRRRKIVVVERAGVVAVAYPNIAKYRDEYAARPAKTEKQAENSHKPIGSVGTISRESGRYRENVPSKNRYKGRGKAKPDVQKKAKRGGSAKKRTPPPSSDDGRPNSANTDARFDGFLKFAKESWTKNKGRAPHWGERDREALRAFLSTNAGITPTDLKRVWDAYLQSDDKFASANGFNLKFFVSNFDAHALVADALPSCATADGDDSLGD